MTTTTSDSAAKKDIQKLQRVIVDALENVKAQEIVVFDTEKLSALFERVMIASGTSNRQTRALAMSVRDAVNKAGFGKPRVEGEDNGEWIIIDCGSAVVHVMQPAIRSYYHLEELWGETPVRLKFGAEKVAKTPAKTLTSAQEKIAKDAAKPTTLRRSSAAKTGVAEAFPSKAALKKEADAAKKTAVKAATKTAVTKPAAKKSAASADAAAPAVKKVVVKAAAKKAPSKTASVKKAPAKKVAAKKA